MCVGENEDSECHEKFHRQTSTDGKRWDEITTGDHGQVASKITARNGLVPLVPENRTNPSAHCQQHVWLLWLVFGPGIVGN